MLLCNILPQKSSKEELEGEIERQKRNFQRQLNDSRTRSHSVTQMRSEMLALQEKISRLTTDNEKLKTTNQVRTQSILLNPPPLYPPLFQNKNPFIDTIMIWIIRHILPPSIVTD